MVVFHDRAPVAEQLYPPRQLGIAGRHRAAVAKRAEVFPGVKTKTRRHAERAARAAVAERRAVRLRGVLDEGEAVFARKRAKRVHVRRLAVEVDGHDGLGARRDGGGDGGGVEQVVVR